MWSQSDHAKAMSEPSSESINADLTQTYADQYNNHFSIKKEQNTFYALLTEQGINRKFKIEKTFGHYPLQQYLVATGNGHLQVLPYSWDARPKEQDGQRWFHINQGVTDKLDTENRYHWQQPLQNWNGMCADCHSSQLQRNFDSDNNLFNSAWKEINVGCLSCHNEHAPNYTASNKPTGTWQRDTTGKVAKWIGEPRNTQTIETCFSCHSLREPLTDGFSAQGHYLDKHSPSLLELPFYYPDGQIKDEVYVYGSFMQSKMAQAGVNCLDCHDKHNMKVKVQGDGLCLSCHSADEYFTNKHNKHQGSTDSTQCVDCHMPETTYMGVDARRDHSFIIPNAPLAHAYQSPDVCLSCHTDKNKQWSINAYKSLFGEVPPRSDSSHTFALARAGKLSEHNKLWLVINDINFPVIKRAATLMLLPQLFTQLTGEQLTPYLNSKEELIRLAATKISSLLTEQDKAKYLGLRLTDPRKAVRVEAVKQLLYNPIPERWHKQFIAAVDEFNIMQDQSLWRAEGLLNQADKWLGGNEPAKAIALYLAAIKRDPYFDGSYINLAELYRQLGKKNLEQSIYAKAINNKIATPAMHFSFGLFFIRQGKLQESVLLLSQAAQADASNSHYRYIYLLSLQKMGYIAKYNIELNKARTDFPKQAIFFSVNSL
ncbi:hypothetical protein [Moritella sp. Urea-trap-13]|uniref:hypothetical protein n=1 Tax=Moritella sp. Urea-trap-13 TaxID=2058327 RepID=UPI000C33DFE0|nr:hypothetical protein [Moritella sp. Urea-trap-13]PKH09382.1 hypothetical protein CXF93_00625 [Moritella sp. Urea-trap-13]